MTVQWSRPCAPSWAPRRRLPSVPAWQRRRWRWRPSSTTLEADAAPREAGGGQVDDDEFIIGLNHFACVSPAVVVIKSDDLSDISTVKRPDYWGRAV
jgi:hypothetical protein